jgi:hypothetical protein
MKKFLLVYRGYLFEGCGRIYLIPFRPFTGLSVSACEHLQGQQGKEFLKIQGLTNWSLKGCYLKLTFFFLR